MKRKLLFCAALLLFLGGACQAALSYGADYYIQHLSMTKTGNKSVNPIYLFMNEVETAIEGATLEGGTTLTFSTYGGTFDNAADNKFEWNENSDELIWSFGSNTVTVSSGDVTLFDFGTIVLGFDQFKVNATTYTFPTADGSNGQVLKTNGSGVLSWAANAGGITDLDTAYDGGASITADGGAVTITNTDPDTAFLLDVYPNASGSAALGGIKIRPSANSTEDALQITNSGSGYSISCDSDTFTVSAAAAVVAASLELTGSAGLTLSNDATITNSVDGAVKITEGGEDLSMTFNANTLTLSTSTGLDSIAFGAVDDLEGVGSISFDAAAASITTATSGDAQDLTIGITNAHDSSLILSSSGTNADAFQIITTAGGIDITNGGAAGGEDIDIDAVLASLNLNADEDVAEAVTITASAGGIDITADGAAGKDLDLVCTNGSTNLSGGEAAADAVAISAGAGGITVTSASTYDIDVTASGGKVLLTGNENAAGAVTIDTAGGGGTTETILVSNDQGTSVTEGAYAIGAVAAAGGVELRSTANLAKSVALTSDGGTTGSIWVFNDQGTSVTEGSASVEILSDDGGVELRSTADLANAVSLTADGGTASTIQIFNDQGTSTTEGAASIELLSDVGSIELKSGLNAADAVNIMVDGDTSSGITVFNDTGTGAQSIYLLTDLGGITGTASAGPIAFTATGAETGDMTLTAGDNMVLDATGGVNFSDNDVNNVGDLSCDDIVSDANALIIYGVKCKMVTIDVDDDASTDDFSFDDDAADQVEQGVRVMTLPAYSTLLAVDVRCFETVTGSASMGIEIGTASGGNQIVTTSDCDSAGDTMGTAAAESPEIAGTSSAINIYVSGTPGANWNALDAGRWFITVTYIDNGAMYAQKNP